MGVAISSGRVSNRGGFVIANRWGKGRDRGVKTPLLLALLGALCLAPALSAAGKNVTGQVFVSTRGAGAYKFGGVVVRVFSLDSLERLKRSQEMNLPLGYRQHDAETKRADQVAAWVAALKDEPQLGSTRTDADGRFSLTLSEDAPAFIFCGAMRTIGRYTEWDLWVVPLDGDAMILTNENRWEQPD
jgi:hypothetical protein